VAGDVNGGSRDDEGGGSSGRVDERSIILAEKVSNLESEGFIAGV
jgi:hypothetical protein